MNERPLIMKMRQDYRFFGGVSILYGIVFAFCLYKNMHGVTFPVCGGYNPDGRTVYAQDPVSAAEGISSIYNRNNPAGDLHCADHFLFPALFQSAGDRSSVFCADDPSVL